MKHFAGRTAVITGAGSGFGLELSRMLRGQNDGNNAIVTINVGQGGVDRQVGLLPQVLLQEAQQQPELGVAGALADGAVEGEVFGDAVAALGEASQSIATVVGTIVQSQPGCRSKPWE